MPVRVNGQTYYRTAEVYRAVGISRTTFFRWLKEASSKKLDTGIGEGGGYSLKMK